MTLKLAIFDMDGTLVDSREVIQTAMATAFERCGLVPPDYNATRQIVGLGLSEACRRLAPDYHDLPRLVSEYKSAFVARRSDPDFKEPLYDGAVETLERLANDNWLIAMATGKSHAGIKAVFSMHPLGQYFDTVWCADDGPGKPHPFMCLEAMNAVGADAGQSLIIGDAVFDMQMGRAAGIQSLGVSWGFGEAHELDAAGAHEVHDDFASLNTSLDLFATELA
ncbi:MAG: HAD-IA family hydrolase [Pseudomonadota bacterium]